MSARDVNLRARDDQSAATTIDPGHYSDRRSVGLVRSADLVAGGHISLVKRTPKKKVFFELSVSTSFNDMGVWWCETSRRWVLGTTFDGGLLGASRWEGYRPRRAQGPGGRSGRVRGLKSCFRGQPKATARSNVAYGSLVTPPSITFHWYAL